MSVGDVLVVRDDATLKEVMAALKESPQERIEVSRDLFIYLLGAAMGLPRGQ